MTIDTKPLSERLRACIGTTSDDLASTCISALDAKDALLRKAREFVLQFIQAATEDESIVSSPNYKSDDVAWFADEARSLLSKLTEATKP